MDRFDRQLRLWGGFGHGLLTDSKLCFIAENRHEPLLLEVQRHLLLAGVSRFVVFTHSDKDLQSSAEHGGKSGGFSFIDESQELESLNPQVKPQWEFYSSSELQQQAFEEISVVVILNCNHGTILRALSDKRKHSLRFPPVLLAAVDWPLAHTYLWLREPHFVLTTNPEYTVPDLRLTQPWPELSHYMDSIDLTALREEQLAELPYPVIVFKALRATVSQDDENCSLQQKIDQYYLSLSPRAVSDTNFRQAKRSARQVSRNDDIGRERAQLLLNRFLPTWQEHNWHSSLNWQLATLCKALALFLDKYHQLPLSGGDFPDMEAATHRYNELKSIYLAKSAADSRALRAILCQLGSPEFPELLLQKFCENINHWTVIEPVTSLDNDSMPNIFSSGAASQNTDHDELFAAMTADELRVAQKLLKSVADSSEPYSSSSKPKLDSPINSFPATACLGGIVSQEVVKLITHQYVPVDNTFVYDFYEDESLTFKI